ncbi:unnamed protein product [Pleuronectes platessa]|uniref:Uncharacterized protein n=1 Tax=Pleuronectes platessa TaxID=8262 RepID=A0A9N7UZ16_PLEPL|nr:unnamed protein product [Pleuronectes platessa]
MNVTVLQIFELSVFDVLFKRVICTTAVQSGRIPDEGASPLPPLELPADESDLGFNLSRFTRLPLRIPPQLQILDVVFHHPPLRTLSPARTMKETLLCSY